MSAENGASVLKVGVKGRLKIEVEGYEPVTVDVIDLENQWRDLDRSFRDDKGQVPPEKQTTYNDCLYLFVHEFLGLVDAGKKIDAAKALPVATVLELWAGICKECLRLRAFFEITTPGAPSSAERTEVTFSR